MHNNKDGSRAPTISKIGFFVTLANGWKPLRNVTKSSILDVAGARDMPQSNGTMCKSNLDEQSPVLHVLYYF